jgi:hypothetical protein
LLQEYLDRPSFDLILSTLIVALIATARFVYKAWHNHKQYVFKYGETFDPLWLKIKDGENEPARPKRQFQRKSKNQA